MSWQVINVQKACNADAYDVPLGLADHIKSLQVCMLEST